jgi:hypothetical protein
MHVHFKTEYQLQRWQLFGPHKILAVIIIPSTSITVIQLIIINNLRQKHHTKRHDPCNLPPLYRMSRGIKTIIDLYCQ